MAPRSLTYYAPAYIRLALTFRNGIAMAHAHHLRSDCSQATLWRGHIFRNPPKRAGLVETAVEVWGTEVYRRGDFYRPSSEHVVMDIGANVGLFSGWLSHHANGINVIAFEPFLENLTALRANLQPWPNVRIHACAVGGQHGSASMIPVGPRSLDHQLDTTTPGDTPVITLTEAVDLAGPSVDLLKMDIEGSEYDVFAEQPSAVLMRRIRRIVIEWHEHVRPGVLALLRTRLAPTHAIVSVTDDDPRYGMLYAVLRD